uniref:sedoheptulokinase n=1 Tax=Ciona intestinalis TaxID=7719 RepID=UPI000180B450|nr:sedoheptulokinase [Ciona intestinalis]|eukprot:XP_002123905.1 sedoheptulokinase [Ciona intestinalis]
MTYTLGIDIGTTSSKVVVVNENNEIITSHSYANEADIVGVAQYKEQSVGKILSSLDRCMVGVKGHLGGNVERVHRIAICGQMHGCVLWEDCDITNTSNLVTWQDARCNEEFISSLPKSKHRISSGFGCATLFWLSRNTPNVLDKYDCCGTISDYVVTMLCGGKPIMTSHNAYSWGYFDCDSGKWERETLTTGDFPTQLLPHVVTPGSIGGHLTQDWYGVKRDTPVLAAMGDLQCSVRSCDIGVTEAVINVSTSAQISKVSRKHQTTASVTSLPYFDRHELLTSASLNGGAVFAAYVTMMTSWTRQFAPDVTVDDVYARIINADEAETEMRFLPALFGERHDPHLRAALNNIGHCDVTIGSIGRAICRGIVQNLRDMFGVCGDDVTRIYVCGGAFNRNQLLRHEAAIVFSDKDLCFDKNCDAAYGATMVDVTS